MGAPGSGIAAAEQPAAETLLGAFKSIGAAERGRHAIVLSYWLSIRGDKEFPPLHDLDPLQISEAGPSSVLLELISGGHDAEIRHLGEDLRAEAWPEQIMDAPNPSILACIAKKLPIVAISRDFLAFQDEYSTAEGKTRCWVTLLPLSGGGAWVDYVYGLVSFETVAAKGAKPAKAKSAEPEEADAGEIDLTAADETVEPVADKVEELTETVPEEVAPERTEVAAEEAVEPEQDEAEQAAAEPEAPQPAPPKKSAPGFSKLVDSLAGLTGFYAQGVKVEPVISEESNGKAATKEAEQSAEPVATAQPEEEQPLEPVVEQTDEGPVAEAPADEPAASEPEAEPAKPHTTAAEAPLQTKLDEVRAKADEARQAKLRANVALYEGLGAAYDFALDAEDAPEEYLKLVEAQGLKIQLRSPMKPVVKLAFDGMCDDMTIKQLEAVLAWAFDEELPRGSLAERIEEAGGIARILTGDAKAA